MPALALVAGADRPSDAVGHAVRIDHHDRAVCADRRRVACLRGELGLLDRLIRANLDPVRLDSSYLWAQTCQ